MLKKFAKTIPKHPAPEFQLKNEKGEIVSLRDFQGKYVYIDFWATWCVPCIKEMTIMPALQEKYGPVIEFVSISIDAKEGKWKKL